MLPPNIYKAKKFYDNPRTNPFITNCDFIFENKPTSTRVPVLQKESSSTKSQSSLSSLPTFHFREPTVSNNLHTAPGEDPEVIHEFPYKDTIILRQMHVKLRRLFGEPKSYIGTEPTPRSDLPFSSKDTNLEEYLNYLKKIQGPDEFKQHLRDKDREIQRQEKMNHALSLGLPYDQQLSIHLKKLVRPDLVESPIEKRFRRNAGTHWTGLHSNTVLRPHLLEEKKPPVRRFSKKEITSFLEGSFDMLDIDPAELAKIRALAKDIVANYKIFMETTFNNKDVYREIKIELEKERVLDLFFSRQPKSMAKLEKEIITTMILTKPPADESPKKTKVLPKVGVQANKVALFERVNHYFLDANAKFHISVFKTLEKDIGTVHEEMAFKSKALKDKLQFFDRKRLAFINNNPVFATPNLPGHLEILSPGEEIRKFEAVHGEMKSIPNEKKRLTDEIQESILRIRQKLSSP